MSKEVFDDEIPVLSLYDLQPGSQSGIGVCRQSKPKPLLR